MSVEKIPLWLDCDPGHDDAFAILLAGHHEAFHLLGVSTVAGNASLEKTTNNALSVLQAIGIDNVRVHKGAASPYCRPFNAAPDIHGESGLDGTDLLPQPSRKALTTCHAIQDMHDALMATHPQTAWLVATGPFTNIGLLFAVYPQVAKHIRGLSLMGGAVGDGFTNVYMGPGYTDACGDLQPRAGNVTPFAEFNVWCDPESARSVLQNPELQSKTVLIPLDLTHQACATKAIRETLLRSKGPLGGTTRLRRMINDLLMFFAQTYEKKFGLSEGPPMHDPLTIAVILAQEVKGDGNAFDDRDGERWAVDVVLEGNQLGRTVVKPSERGILIPRSFDNDAFWQSIERALARADEATGHAQ